MSQPFVGEIRMVGFNFAPVGWALCDGSLMAISQNDTLFNLIGTTYGGDGQNTFALPDLRGRVPVHMGQGPGLSGYIIGELSGLETVTITKQQLPPHTHPPSANGAGPATSSSPVGNVWCNSGANGTPYSNVAPASPMNAAALQSVGGNQPHDNMLPFQCISFVISLFGIFPSQS
jgi:microcystin-dependent protein